MRNNHLICFIKYTTKNISGTQSEFVGDRLNFQKYSLRCYGSHSSEIIEFSRRLKFTFGSPVHSTLRSEN